MSAMLREHGLLKELAEAKERIKQLEAQAYKVPAGWKVVPKSIHPLDTPGGEKVMRLLDTPPSAEHVSNPQDYYQYWWTLLLAAAPVQENSNG